MPSPRSSRSRLVFRGLLVAAALLLLAEGAARLWLTSPSAQRFDPDLGWRWRPGVVAANYSEGGQPFTANAIGFNDDPVAAKTKPRVVAYGNSFLEAIQVTRAENYTTLLEARGLDVINLGRSAMGPPHYPIVERVVGRALNPDITLVHLGEGDLLFSVSPEVEVREEDGRIVAVDFPVLEKDQLKARFGFILERSALATSLMRRLKPVVARWFGLATDAAAAPVTSEAERAAQQAEGERRLRWILSQLAARGRVVVLNAPSLKYDARKAWIANPWQGEAYARAAAAAGAEYVDAGPALVAHYGATQRPPFGFHNLQMGVGHLNADGHKVIAAVLGPVLAEPAR